MGIAKKLKLLLQDHLKDESIKTVVELVEFLKFKENEEKFQGIDESDVDTDAIDEQPQL